MTHGQAELANQSLRDQFQIVVKFQMIFLCVAAAAAFHFEFTLVENESYYSAPTTLRCDQGCNPFLVGGCSVGQAKALFNRTSVPKARVRRMDHQPTSGNSVSIQRLHVARVPGYFPNE